MLANLRLSREPETCDCNSAPGTLQMSSVTIIETRPATAPEAQKFRHEIGQISRQSAVFFAGTMFTSVAAYAFKIYLARALGAEALGIYALGMTAVGAIGTAKRLGAVVEAYDTRPAVKEQVESLGAKFAELGL